MSQVLAIVRKQDRVDAIRYEVLIEHIVNGITVQGTYNLNYREDPDQAMLDADVAKRVSACDLFDQVKSHIKGDNRADAAWIDQDGNVRVLLSNRVCPNGCEVRSLPELPLVLARLPKVKPRPDVSKVLSRYGAPNVPTS